ncbi:MAG TPA: hypothetical protein VL068_13405 [Microthrixaceae bacterium]|nr:hypothetical protein [Microthrixaceae bacterium]
MRHLRTIQPRQVDSQGWVPRGAFWRFSVIGLALVLTSGLVVACTDDPEVSDDDRTEADEQTESGERTNDVTSEGQSSPSGDSPVGNTAGGSGDSGNTTGGDTAGGSGDIGNSANSPGSVATGNRGRPQSVDCKYLEESADGTYDLGEAGKVRISRDGNTLSLEKLSPAAGWTTQVDSDNDDPDEIELSFNKDNRRIEFEAEIEDNGSLEIKTCVVTFKT